MKLAIPLFCRVGLTPIRANSMSVSRRRVAIAPTISLPSERDVDVALRDRLGKPAVGVGRDLTSEATHVGA